METLNVRNERSLFGVSVVFLFSDEEIETGRVI
jgi:hypothetical protein